jgi:S1-C subfamily serine protease
MNRVILSAVAAVSISLVGCKSSVEQGVASTGTPVTAPDRASSSMSPAAILEKARKSLVTVQYTVDNEMGKRELSGTGAIVRADGLVAVTMGLIPLGIPDVQLTEFKVILPPGVDGPETVELAAEFVGRDERADLAYVRVKQDAATTKRVFTPIEFATSAVSVGDPLVSIGLLPKSAGYTPYAKLSTVAAKLRGPTPTVMASGGLAGVGALVFSASDGKLVGFVQEMEGQNLLAGARGPRGQGGQDDGALEMAQLMLAPIFYVPVDDFLVSLKDPPVAEKPRLRPWLGVGEMNGLEEDVASFYGLKGTPAIQVSDVIPGFPAAEGGVKAGDIIVSMNGQPLERGDAVDELPAILQRKLLRMNVGETVTFGVVRKQGEKAQDVKVTLGERPGLANRSPRQYFEDLGYSVRGLVFDDTYARKLDRDYKGVMVAFVRPQSSAQAGRLQRGDIITKLNQTPIDGVEQFKTAYDAFRKEKPKEAVVMEVYRGTGTEIVRIQPPG